MFASVFRLGHWAKNEDCCWKCTCSKAQLREFDLSASWRSSRLTHSALLLRCHQKGVKPSPIFWMPFFSSNVFKIDWLHTMDLGCAAEWIGNLFNHVLPKLPGNSSADKCKHLFLLIKSYYDRHPEAPAQYNNLVPTMFRQGKKGFKLRGKAAEIRGLVGFSHELATTHLSREDPLEATMIHGTSLLCTCYGFLASDADMTNFPSVARQFCILWRSLEEMHGNSKLWKVKPKAHLLCELAEFTKDKPSKTWCYRDEEFGGTIANLARLRGGKKSPLALGRNVLLKFSCTNSIPIL